MFGLKRKARFDPDTLSSIWVMACRDESPVLTGYSVAYRLDGGITPAEVIELVRGRRELFRIGLTRGQCANGPIEVASRIWRRVGGYEGQAGIRIGVYQHIGEVVVAAVGVR